MEMHLHHCLLFMGFRGKGNSAGQSALPAHGGMWLKGGKEKGLGLHLYLFLELVSCTDSVVLGKHKRLVKYFIALIAAKEKTPRIKKKKKIHMRRMTALKILIKINPSRPLEPFWLQLLCFAVPNTHSLPSPVPMAGSRNVGPCLKKRDRSSRVKPEISEEQIKAQPPAPSVCSNWDENWKRWSYIYTLQHVK